MPEAENPAPRLQIRAMTEEDIPAVMEIDRLSFPNPWPESSFFFEIRENRASRLMVLERTGSEPARVVAFIGYWLVEDEAHISTFAVHPDFRGRGLGRMLITAMLEAAGEKGMRTATLEVRRGNGAAQALYRDLGFSMVGVRKAYYKDNGEDAILMTVVWPSSVAAERETAPLDTSQRGNAA